MTENDVDDYAVWLKDRRVVHSDGNLTDRIMAAVENRAACSPVPTSVRHSARTLDRIGPVLLWTAASLVFVARIASLVGNLVFPTESFPEFAADHRIEEPADEHRNASRS